MTLPVHFFFSPEGAGGDGTIDSDVNTNTGFSASFTLNGGVPNLDVDVGLIEAPTYFSSNSIAVIITDVQILPDGTVMVADNVAIDNVLYNLQYKSDADLTGSGVWLDVTDRINLRSTNSLLISTDAAIIISNAPRRFYRFVFPDVP